MTAEIAILNRAAVALAADSAVTVGAGGGQKTYNTVNKLFGLSKFEPVGVMVYGNAELLGVPWETIVKSFRRKLGKTKFPILEEYSHELLRFLGGNTVFFPDHAQQAAARRAFDGLFTSLARRAKDIAPQRGRSQEEELQKRVAAFNRTLASRPYLQGFSDDTADSALEGLEAVMNEARAAAFEGFSLSPDLTSLIRQAAVYAVSKDHTLGDVSGIVVAGFGEDDVFPAITTLRVYSVVQGRPRVSAPDGFRVTLESKACVMPFAQQELVATFMEGVDPNYRTYLDGAVGDILRDEYPALLAQALAARGGGDAAALTEDLAEIGRGVMEQHEKRTEAYRAEKFVQPLIRAVDVLPRDDQDAKGRPRQQADSWSLGRGSYFRARSRSIESRPRSITSRTTCDVTRSTPPARLESASRTRSRRARSSEGSRTTSCRSFAAPTTGRATYAALRSARASVVTCQRPPRHRRPSALRMDATPAVEKPRARISRTRSRTSSSTRPRRRPARMYSSSRPAS